MTPVNQRAWVLLLGYWPSWVLFWNLPLLICKRSVSHIAVKLKRNLVKNDAFTFFCWISLSQTPF